MNNDKSWEEIIQTDEKLEKKITKICKEARKNNHNYLEVYAAMHTWIDIIIYKAETIEKLN